MRDYETQFDNKYSGTIGKETVIEYLNQSRENLSFKYTTTFCKKCAFLWDHKGMRLCVIFRLV